MVEEVVVKKHVADFKDIENPKTIEITFTLSGMEFEGAGEENAAEDVAIESMELEVVDNADGTYSIIAKVTPENATEKIYFASEDESVAAISQPLAAVENGKAQVLANAFKIGGTKITAYAEGMATAEILLGVSGITPAESEAASVGDIIPAPEVDISHETDEQPTEPQSETESTTPEETQTSLEADNTSEPGQQTSAASSGATLSTGAAVAIIVGVVLVAGIVVVILLKPKKDKTTEK